MVYDDFYLWWFLLSSRNSLLSWSIIKLFFFFANYSYQFLIWQFEYHFIGWLHHKWQPTFIRCLNFICPLCDSISIVDTNNLLHCVCVRVGSQSISNGNCKKAEHFISTENSSEYFRFEDKNSVVHYTATPNGIFLFAIRQFENYSQKISNRIDGFSLRSSEESKFFW